MTGEPTVSANLAERIAAGEEAAFRIFYDATAARAYGLALRITASPDTATKACENAYASLPALVRRVGGDFWRLETVFLNAVREMSLPQRALPSIPSTDPQGPSYTMVKAIRDCLDGMDPAARRALELAYYGGLGVQAIADIIGQPVSELRPILRDVLLRLGAATGIQQEGAR